jgi:tripartite-type tricarboxylate transporter receptor subunit TctC
MKSTGFRIKPFALAAAFYAITSLSPSFSASYPTRSITIIVPYPAGGPADYSIRLVGNELSARLKQPVIIENRQGAGGSIGMATGARAAPDGYTLTLGSQALAISPHLNQLNFDPNKDIAPISLIVSYAEVLVVSSSSPAESLKDLLELSKSKPETLTYGTAGVGGLSHLASEMLAKSADTKFVMVPFSGGSPALTALMGGHIRWMFDTVSTSLPLIKSGALRPLAYSGLQRNSLIPDVPTVAETFPNFEAIGWFGLYGPAGMPHDIQQRLSDEIEVILQTPKIHKQLIDGGFELSKSSPETFQKFIKEQYDLYGAVIRQFGIGAR